MKYAAGIGKVRFPGPAVLIYGDHSDRKCKRENIVVDFGVFITLTIWYI